MVQHSLILCKGLYFAGVGAVIDRPQAITNRPYESYYRLCMFCNTLYLLFTKFLVSLVGSFHTVHDRTAESALLQNIHTGNGTAAGGADIIL